jgi:hypothetical protein
MWYSRRERRLSGRAGKASAVAYKRAIVHPAPGVLVNSQISGFIRFIWLLRCLVAYGFDDFERKAVR